MYLYGWPERYERIHVLQHIGGGVAPWNHDQYVFSRQNGHVFVDGKPLVFYHFHSLKLISSDIIVPVRYPQYNPVKRDVLELCVTPYVNTIVEHLERMRIFISGFSFGVQSGTPVPSDRTVLCRGPIVNELGRLGKVKCYEMIEISLEKENWTTLFFDLGNPYVNQSVLARKKSLKFFVRNTISTINAGAETEERKIRSNFQKESGGFHQVQEARPTKNGKNAV